MSHLKLYCPEETDSHDAVCEERAILPFRHLGDRISPTISRDETVHRARILRENRCCAFCRSMFVEPLELDDAVISRRNHRPIPGTATIVGFHCHSCSAEWPAYQVIDTPA